MADGSKDHVKFKCAVRKCLINADDDLEILDVAMIPELHIFTGIVNRLVQAFNERWNWDNGHADLFYKWCDKNLILYTGFHGRVISMTAYNLLMSHLS